MVHSKTRCSTEANITIRTKLACLPFYALTEANVALSFPFPRGNAFQLVLPENVHQKAPHISSTRRNCQSAASQSQSGTAFDFV